MRIGTNRKIILLSLGLVSLVFAFFLPIYTGAFTDSDFTRCDACHVREGDEISRSQSHKSIKCTSCHNVSDFAPDLYSHNATTAECIYCHYLQNSTQFIGDAHDNFSNASFNSSIMTGRNEMCVACHTAIDLEIEWHSYKGMNLTVSSLGGAWEMQFTSVSGDNKTIIYNNYTDYLNRTNWTNRSNNS